MPRHSLVVRLTHRINAIASFALIVSGVAILLAHPRLYWGETGGAGRKRAVRGGRESSVPTAPVQTRSTNLPKLPPV
jgi:hypothetical protein